MIEFVDAVGKFGGNCRLRLCATEYEDAVKRTQCSFALVASGRACCRKLRNEMGTRTNEARVGEIEDGPKVAESIFDWRSRKRESRRCVEAT